jgi:Sulfotransferase domain
MRLGPLRPAGRWLTKPARTRPTFLVIGAQKSGTTSLRRYLVEHPAVLCAEPKEIHYFDIEHARGPAWYLAQYPWKTEARAVRRSVGVSPAVGEATPEYLFHPCVPERVHAFDPSLRLVVVLRDPVERAYSHYQMRVRRWGESRSFEEVLAVGEAEMPAALARAREDPAYDWIDGFQHSYVERGKYAEQLERWFGFFPREQFLVLTSTELSDDPATTTSRVTTFLGVPDWHASDYPRLSSGSYEPMAPETQEHLARLFEPHNQRLEELLGQPFDWTRPVTRAA